MSNLLEFLRDLAIDPARLTEFVADPNRAMDHSALDPLGRRVLFGGSEGAMWEHLRGRQVQLPDPPRVTLPEKPGALVVVGTGIRTVGQVTLAAIAWIRSSSAVHYLVADPIAEAVIHYLNPAAVSLMGHYSDGGDRKASYDAMVGQILASVRLGHRTCAVFYGHPGVFAFPSHESIRQARKEGYSAMMLPAISAEDCLFADLGIDPAVNGCQSYEATDFMVHDRSVDTSSQLVLWQVGVLGDRTFRKDGYDVDRLFPLLVQKLTRLYGAEHEVTIYESIILPCFLPRVQKVKLRELDASHVQAHSTMYVPPGRDRVVNAEFAKAMGVVLDKKGA